MVGSPWFLLVVGTSGLHVETDTPSALCPPLEPVREAVRSRLGEVEGGPYEARYSVVRGGNQGFDVLLLTLTDGSGAELLHRELPLTSMGCTDAAEVIALILEGFFQQVSPTETLPPAVPSEAEETELARAPAPVLPARDPEEEEVEPARFRLRGGVFHSDGTPGLGFGAAFQFADFGEFVVDTSWPLVRRTSEEQGLSLASESSWLFGSALFLFDRSPWSFGAGPLLALQIERAVIEGNPALSDGKKARLVARAGAHAVVRFEVSDSLGLEMGLRTSPLFGGEARKFMVIDSEERQTEVLRPEGLAWTVSFGLNLRLGGGP